MTKYNHLESVEKKKSKQTISYTIVMAQWIISSAILFSWPFVLDYK